MNDKVIEELLMMHVDVLNMGTDVTDVLTDHYPELSPFLNVARSLFDLFEMVPVSAEFKTNLHRDLLRTPVTIGPIEPTPNRAPWVIGAAIGSAATGLAVLVAHRLRSQNAVAA